MRNHCPLGGDAPRPPGKLTRSLVFVTAALVLDQLLGQLVVALVVSGVPGVVSASVLATELGVELLGELMGLEVASRQASAPSIALRIDSGSSPAMAWRVTSREASISLRSASET